MPIIEWSDTFLLGVEQFDGHHKHLVHLLNKAYDDLTSETRKENAGRLLDELVDYATYHFAAEEYWMKENAYPKLPEHAAEHDRFSRRIVEMLKDYHAGRLTIPLELVTFLYNWLSSHILDSDADYGRFIAARPAGGVIINLD